MGAEPAAADQATLAFGASSGLTNVEFLEGEIQNIALPNEPVNATISKCVINLSGG